MTGPDRLEATLSELGIQFGRQTVLFDAENEAFAERRVNQLLSGVNVQLPPLEFDWKPGATKLPGQVVPREERSANPIRESMRLTTRSLGKNRPLDLRLRHPRPIYFEPVTGTKQAFDAEFLLTSPESWNEDNPFPTQERVPRYERSKPNDPTKGTRDEKRRGPFSIGVAIETSLPATWYSEPKGKPATVRVAAVGHGGLFIGAELSPAKEQLALNTCNWLLGRDDLLPQADREWAYPRVQLGDLGGKLWHWWGTWLLLPVLFAYAGRAVLMACPLR